MLSWLGLIQAPTTRTPASFFEIIAASVCPLGAQIMPFQSVNWAEALDRDAFYVGHVIVLLFTIGVAFLLLALALVTFNRSMGRMPERRRRPPRPPRELAAARKPHKSGSRSASRPAARSKEPVLPAFNA